MSKKFLYLFKEGHDAFGGDQTTMKNTLGGKGAGLAEMTHAGMPVPQGFTITTEACTQYYADNREINDEIKADIFKYMGILEEQTGKTFGSIENPLLVSVRSGARQSMPGMMDTILNLGLNDQAVEGLAKKTNNPRFAYDCYRRFIQMYSDVVMELGKSFFEERIDAMKERKGVKQDVELDANDLKELVKEFKQIYLEKQGEEFPQDPKEQLIGAVKAVFRSWDNPRANVYRKMNEIPYEWGTAVNVQQMAFGNSGMRSGTGVAFTRNPATGEKKLMGEYLINAQGEDVVAGIRTPSPISKLHEEMPEVYDQFVEIATRLENYYKDMQDMEFTIEDGKLYMLQTRNGKRTAAATVKTAVDMVDEGLITTDEALLRINPSDLDALLHPGIDPDHSATASVKGLPASPGAAVGALSFDADDAAERGGAGEQVILVRYETTPDDIHGVMKAQGVLTAHGGMTSHAAVVARGMGITCVAGAPGIKIDPTGQTVTIGGTVYGRDDVVTLNGSTGEVFAGALPLVPPAINEDFETVGEWADQARRLGVRANAENFEDASKARELGAEGIGLARTEHMFMAADRLPAVRKMILAENEEQRAAALAEILPMQQADFEGIFTAMKGLPVTVRLLDPPLHEFLPNLVDQSVLVKELELTGADPATLAAEKATLAQVKRLHEQNPMLGTRGCRLAMLYPSIPDMQARAIIRAALAVLEREGETVGVEIMIPLVAFESELKAQRDIVVAAVEDEFAKAGKKLDYLVGTMIEIPRAALTADQIANQADFFSFGTNDLTQTGIGISRDDAEAGFLGAYVETEVIEKNPFESLDADGVGQLVAIGVEKGRATKPTLKTGVCGEHGGDPASIEFFNQVGLDYVSCSPFRVPIARLAAARAALQG